MLQQPCICIFASLYLPSIGGVEVYTANLSRALADQGIRVIIVTCNIANLPSKTTESGIEIVRLPCHEALKTRYPLPRRNEEASRLWDYLKQQRIDYVIVNTRFYPLSLKALDFSDSIGVKPIIIEHGAAHLTLGNRFIDIFVRAVEHSLTNRCKRHDVAFYGVSKQASSWLGHFGIAASGELSNSIDADEYASNASGRSFKKELGLPNSTFLVAFIGRFVPEKGVLQLAEAAASLQGSGIVVAFAGDGPLRSKLSSFECDAVRIVGRLDRKDVASLILEANAVCLPSRSEGFATVLLESAACATPALATHVGGTDELIPNESFGTILPEMEPGTISQALSHAQQNQELLISQGRNVHKRVRDCFSWSATAKKAVEACLHAQRNQ